MTNCAKVVPLFDAFVDGELPPERVLDVEEHLESCQECLEHLGLLEAMQHSTRQAVRQAALPSEAFRSRVAAALATERAREEVEAALAAIDILPRSPYREGLELLARFAIDRRF